MGRLDALRRYLTTLAKVEIRLGPEYDVYPPTPSRPLSVVEDLAPAPALSPHRRRRALLPGWSSSNVTVRVGPTSSSPISPKPCGPRGIAEVERQVAARAADVDPDSWSGTWAIRDLREQLAQISGEVDRYVAVMAEHLTHPGRYQQIAQSPAGSGRTDEALGRAQRGKAEHPDHHETDELLDTLVSLMLNLGDQTGALQVRQTEFERRPLATTYASRAATAMAAEAPNPLPYALRMLHERITHQSDLAAELIAVLRATMRRPGR